MLEDAGHLVSVVIPDSSRSWIGKAHLIDETLKVTYLPPRERRGQDGGGDDDEEAGSTDYPASAAVSCASPDGRAWVLVSGTPASCTQLGLYNLFPDREPVDLVISGPNHGGNVSTIYNLASGTLGGAMEAATCGKKAIALSFASKDEQPLEIIQAASRLSVKLIEHLYVHWASGVELYTLNVPMRADVEQRPVLYTRALQNCWSKSSLYQEVDMSPPKISASNCSLVANGLLRQERYFKWDPEFSDIQRSIEASPCGTDAYTIKHGCTR
jgi:5'/3'-nucleotidase SurE